MSHNPIALQIKFLWCRLLIDLGIFNDSHLSALTMCNVVADVLEVEGYAGAVLVGQLALCRIVKDTYISTVFEGLARKKMYIPYIGYYLVKTHKVFGLTSKWIYVISNV